MAKYLIERFDRIADITDLMPPKNQMTSKMQASMTEIDQQTGAEPGKGRWFISKCKTTNGLDSIDAKDEYYLVYFASRNDAPINAKLVAAPCPPFCQDEQGDSINSRLTEIENSLQELKNALFAFMENK